MKLKAHHPESRILIVDDAMESVNLLTHILRAAGFSDIVSTTDPQEALDLYEKTRPHAMLLDLHMPDISGFDVLEQIIGLDANAYVPLLMLTAHDHQSTRLRALEIGAKEFLSKPFDRLEVIARVNTVTEVSLLHERLRSHNRSLEREVRERSRELQLEMRSRLQVEERARHLSLHDELTGFANRTLLMDRLQQCIYLAERPRKSVGVLLVNLDRFQEVNHTLGHAQGDVLLQRVGERLSAALRRGDTVARLEDSGETSTLARLAGDEFALILPMLASTQEACSIAERVLGSFEEPFDVDGLSLDISACISIAAYPEHGEDPQTLLQRADVAMYSAKRGREPVVVYSPEQDHFTANRLTLMGELREAISNDALELHYQPKIDLACGRVTCFEALVRWNHGERGFIPPDQFIPLAEETGMTTQLTRWVLRQAVEQCARFAGAGYDLGMSINLSTHDLMYKGLPEEVTEVLAEHSLPPDSIMLEVTESAMMRDPEQALRTISRMSRTGLRFSIDDFGTGYSSLAYLKKLPVSEVKIDKSFVRDMDVDSDDATIVQSTIDLAHNLGLQVVAEGVESRTILELLERLGCDRAQGYYLARPMSAADAYDWLTESVWGKEPERAAGDRQGRADREQGQMEMATDGRV